MELENVKEYEYIRSETELIRNCITTYMGYVIGGSGAAMFGLAALRVFGPENRVAVGYVSFATSVLVALVLAILFYKFNSHNRYAAYSLVLADESYEKKPDPYQSHDAGHVAWELCIERIRMADRRPSLFSAQAEETFFSQAKASEASELFRWMLSQYLPSPEGQIPRVDHNKFWRGAMHLRLALFGRTKTTSWAFPPPVVAVFFVLSLIYFAIGTYATATYGIDNRAKFDSLDASDTPFVVLVLVAIAVLGLQSVVWRVFCGKLLALMAGSATVDAFAFRFAIARAIFLHRVNVVPRYRAVEALLREERARFEADAARRNHREAD